MRKDKKGENSNSSSPEKKMTQKEKKSSTLSTKGFSLKKALAIVIAIVIVLSGCGISLFAFYQPNPKTNDFTDGSVAPTATSKGSGSGGSDDQSVVLSPSVKTFDDEVANQINKSITGVQTSNIDTVISFDKNTVTDQVKQLGTGDIFMLTGGENDPLQGTYIGKVVSVTETAESIELVSQAPLIDEVFDSATINVDTALTQDNLTSFSAPEGVNVITDNSVTFEDIKSEAGENAKVEYLNKSSNNTPEATPINESAGGSFVVEIDFDLLKAYDCIKNGYKLVKEEDKKDDKDKATETSLKIKGKIGIEDLKFKFDLDYGIFDGIKQFGYELDGKTVAEVGVEFEAKGSIDKLLGKDETEIKKQDWLKLQGLDEKALPLFFMNFTCGMTTIAKPTNEGIKKMTEAVPLTVALVAYFDVGGEVSIKAHFGVSYENAFSVKQSLVIDNKIVTDGPQTISDPKIDWNLGIELQADVDANVGCSVDLYIFNINLIDIAIFKIGAEAQGEMNLNLSSDSSENSFEISGFLRWYLKFCDVNIKFRAKIDLLLTDTSFSFQLSFCILDVDLLKIGSKRTVHFNEMTMEYKKIVAYDDKCVYYKDIDGNLVKEDKNGNREYLMESQDGDSFFAFCGIDASYLYVLKKTLTDNGTYDIHRISKEGKGQQKIIDSVENALTQDENYLYFTDSFNNKEIQKFNRETLATETFHTFSEKVTYMSKEDDNYFVVTQDDSFFSSFFGAACNYYILNSKGEIIKECGTEPDIKDFPKRELSDYNVYLAIVSGGYLRDTASKVYWASSDSSTTVLTETVSGWNPKEQGVFVTLNNDSQSENALPYKIVLYSSKDGSQKPVTEVNSDQAFFTICSDSNNNYYYFDQVDSKLILYKMNSDFSVKTVEKEFESSEINCSLNNCSMEIVNNRLYFYEMIDNTTSNVLYRYDLL